MIGRKDYNSAARAVYLMDVLFAWLLLEAHDKGCTERVFGRQQPEKQAILSAALGAMRNVLQSCLRSLWNLTIQLGIRHFWGQGGLDACMPWNSLPDHIDVAASGWEGCIMQNLPKQKDCSSCGVFMTAFAEEVLCGWSPPYKMSQADVHHMRMAIAASLLALQSATPRQVAPAPFSLPE
jgi:hypothetical protein